MLRKGLFHYVSDSSLKEGHVYNHASNYLAVDYQLIVYE